MMAPTNRRDPSTPVHRIATADDSDAAALKYGQSTPGTMARTPKIVSPLGVFSRWTRKGDPAVSSSSESDADSVSLYSTRSRLGIRRPTYRSDDDQSKQSSKSCRIGIERTAYILPDGDIPLSPLNLYLDKKGSSPPPHLIEIEDDLSKGIKSPWSSSSRRSIHSPASGTQLLIDSPSQVSDEDSVERMVHKQTAEGHYLLNSQAVASPDEEIRFSLSKGKRGMPSFMRRASAKHLRKPVERFPVTEGIRDMDASFKVFVLLLSPKAKIFELIQLIYSPTSATIATILDMIPANATEPALGSQEYLGLCRPKDGIAILDRELMASGSSCKISCARITRGEILVAIPSGYSSSDVSTLAIPILANPRIVKLLKRSDPLSARKTSRRRSSRGRPRSRLNTTISVVETVREETSEDERSLEEEVHRAMEHAMMVAAAANAGISEEDQESIHSRGSAIGDDVDEPHPSLRHVGSADESIATGYHSAGNYSSVRSIAETRASDFHTAAGYNSSSNSLAYFSESSTTGLYTEANTFQSGVAKRRMRRRGKTRRRDRRSNRNAAAMRVACGAVAYMVFRYVTDTTLENEEDLEEDDVIDSPMGILGLTQGLVLLMGLMKLQAYAEANDTRSQP